MEVDQLFVSLSSLNSKDAYKNLKRLQKSLKKGKVKGQFIEKDGISNLVLGLSTFSESHDEQQRLDVTSRSSAEGSNCIDRSVVVAQILSCLTKLVIGNRTCLSQFLKANGLQVIGNLLLCCSNELSIKSICSLILAAASKSTVNEELAATLVNVLPQYKDTQLAVTILRSLWTICSSVKSICVAATASGFPTVVKLLSSDNKRIVKASVRVLYRFLKGSNNDKIVALKVLGSDGLQLLLALMQKKLFEDDYCMVSDCLFYMIKVPQVRVSENCANFINFCTTELTRDSDSKRFQNAFLSLCLCAMEAMNRIKMRCTGALEKFVDFLGKSQYSKYHFQIVSTFVCFLFDDPSLVVMLRAGLLTNLLNYLEEIMTLQSEDRLDRVVKILLPNYSPFASPGETFGPASADGSSPNILGARGPFHDVMLLLGKLSRTLAIRFMVSKSCINLILKYLSTVERFDSKAEKILMRITENPQFFELLLKLGVIQSIYFELNTCYSITYLEDIVRQVTSARSSMDNLLGFSTEIISFREFSKAFYCCSGKRIGDSDSSTECKIGADKVMEESKDGPDVLRENKCNKRRCAKSLISSLSHHAESSFGQGALTHALLSDSSEIKEAFTIAYCYLCRSPQFKRHIFIELKGLELIINLILRSADDDKKLCDGFLALSGLAKSVGVNHKKRTARSKFDWESDYDVMRVLSFDEGIQEGTESKILSADQQNKKFPFCCILSNLFCKLTLLTPANSSSTFQRTSTSLNESPKYGLDKVCFYLEESVTMVVKRDAILSASPVFAAMLSKSFVDSSLPFVSLKDVHAASFLILLHHMHGCIVDLESLSCVRGCKFDGTVKMSSKANTPESSREGKVDIEEATALFKTCKDFDCMQWEEKNKDSKEVDCKRVIQNIEIKETQSDDQITEFNCCAKFMSKDQKLCLVTDLMRISDRFLLDELRRKCEEYLTNQLTVDTAALFYMEALSCQARFLSESCVRYILADMEDPVAYLKAVVTLYTSVEKFRFMEDLKSALESQIDCN